MTLQLLERRLNPYKEKIKSRLLSYLLTSFPAAPIPDAATHRRYLKAVKVLMEALESDELEGDNRAAAERFLSIIAPVIEQYEAKARPAGKAEATDILRFLMEQHRLAQKDLASELGGQSVVSEILSGKRQLNLDQVKALGRRFNVSPASFIPV